MKTNLSRFGSLFALCVAGSVIYELAYLSYTYYDVMVKSFKITNTQMGNLMSVFGIVAIICYFPGGWLADKFSSKWLIVTSLVVTGVLGLWEMTLPSYPVLIAIYFLWGISLTLTFWAAMLKATRTLGNSNEQGRLYGILEGGRGLIPLLYGLVVVAIFKTGSNDVAGLVRVILSYSVLNFIGAAIVLLFFRNDKNDEATQEKSAPVLKDIVELIKMPNIWLVAGIVFVSYLMYTSFSYITPYLTGFCGVGTASAATIALIRTYGIAIFGGALSGFLADKTGSRSRMLIYSFAVGVVGVIAFLFTKATPGSAFIVIGAMLITGLGIFMTRGIYFAVTDEIKISARVCGSAIGLISFVGFIPDAFSYSLIGSWLDRYKGATPYKMIFVLMLICALLGVIFSIILRKNCKAIQKTATSDIIKK